VFTLATRAQQRAKPIEVPTPNRIQPLGISTFDLQAPLTVAQTPVHLIGVIAVPGAPLASFDITWTDQVRGRWYLADRSNRSVDIFDAVNDLYLGRVTGFVGPNPTVNGPGPNGVVVTPDNQLWVGDGDSTAQVVDLNLDPPRIIKSIRTGGASDNRADELGYDPLEHITLIANNAATPPFLTFISADSYSILGKLQLPDASGLEQPVWDSQLHRFLVTVRAAPNSYIAVIDPTKMTVTKKYALSGCSAAGLALGPFQRLLVSCDFPIIMNAIDGHTMANITQVHGGDQIWYNAGDGRLYVTSTDAAGTTVLGAIDVETGTWIQNVPVLRGRNPTAFEGNNHIFVPVAAPAAGVTDTSVCASFGLKDTGCIAVFSH
jgi:hypothetical protein